jgi:endonuclease/exonuclease/phosphatase family metal-dependent hydrolase
VVRGIFFCYHKGNNIDRIIYRKSTAYKVGTALADDGVLESDHRPVFVDLEL